MNYLPPSHKKLMRIQDEKEEGLQPLLKHGRYKISYRWS
jgi:hypothetical protein